MGDPIASGMRQGRDKPRQLDFRVSGCRDDAHFLVKIVGEPRRLGFMESSCRSHGAFQ